MLSTLSTLFGRYVRYIRLRLYNDNSIRDYHYMVLPQTLLYHIFIIPQLTVMKDDPLIQGKQSVKTGRRSLGVLFKTNNNQGKFMLVRNLFLSARVHTTHAH